ncbi:MAG: ATP-dependent nuclease [Candidatus Hodarchaeales archaeon]
MAKIIKFRIKNYKSIKDSGDCYLSNNITVLAGRNESGKTSILEALEDFDTEKAIRQDAVPIHDSNLKPEISITFELEKEEFGKISENIIADKENRIILKKSFDNEYSIINTEELFSKIIKPNKSRIKLFEKNRTDLKKIFDRNNIKLELDAINEGHFSKISNQLSILNTDITRLSRLSELDSVTALELISTMEQIIGEFVEPKGLEEEFLKDVGRYIPNFILFDIYNDQIPNKVPIAQLGSDKFIGDLAAISDLDVELIQDPAKKRENLKHKDKVNINLSEEYEKFWNQDAANLYLDWDNENLFFWIKENEEYYEPKQRSRGRQWHLSFYVRVTARSREDVSNIILIDEPGLFLHAKAQRDILKKLEESSKDLPIIFSTHSPYLIDPNNLNRVRLVEKSEEKGTTISKVHAKADRETLTPILTAIGEDLSQGIRVDIKNSFVVEGISDYYYLHAFKKILSFDKEINLVPGCGDNIPAIASILFGWGLDPYFILDSDKQRIVNKLKKKLDISEDVIIKILDEKGTVEDVFSEDDFKKFVIEDEDADLTGGFISLIKDNGGKELLAKKFLEKVDSKEIKKNSLSKQTIENIEGIFEKISDLLNELNDSN